MNLLKQAIQLKLQLAKTAPKKYAAMKLRSELDGRMHDNLLYHAATTARWGSTGINLQNLARPKIKDTYGCIDTFQERDYKLLDRFYDHPMEALSSCVRGMLIAEEGKTFLVGDYSQIEARVLVWLAGQQDLIEAYAQGVDVYKLTASKIYHKPVDEITDDERFNGKTGTLSLGYGGGRKAFMKMAKQFGIGISEDLAERIKKEWRENNPKTVKFWGELENSAIQAIRYPGTKIEMERLAFIVDKKFLQIQLPSKRILYYYRPELRKKKVIYFKTHDETPKSYVYNEHEYTVAEFKQLAREHDAEIDSFYSDSIRFIGINSQNGKAERQYTYGGKFTENVVSGVARDIMGEACLRLQNAGYNITLLVHDEIITEDSADQYERFIELMKVKPKWCEGLPIDVGGFVAERYRK